MYNSEDYAGIAMSAEFEAAMQNSKYANKSVGGNPPVVKGVVVTFEKLDFADNKDIITPATYNTLTPRQKGACVKREDGMYDRDNSYFCVQTSGSLGRVSYSSLSSYCQHVSKLTDKEQKELQDALKAEKKTESDILVVTPGSVDYVSKQIAGKLGGKYKVVFQHKFPKGWKPAGASADVKGLAFDTRMDVYVPTV